MQDLNDKVTGGTLTAAEFNQSMSEIQNVIEALGQTLSGADLNQLGKGVAGYAANGSFYTDSGATNAYVLTTIGGKQAPPVYNDGIMVMFSPSNANTGASTVNPAGLGVKNIKTQDGLDPGAGVIASGKLIVLVYRLALDWFEILSFGGAGLADANTFTATQTWAKGADLTTADVVAGVLTLGSDGNTFNFTGTDTITSIAGAAVGTTFKINFDAAATLTHHATDLILLGGANITTAAGDWAEFFVYAAGDVKMTNYGRAAGISSLLAETTVSGSAVTSIDFTGLDINTHQSYRVEMEWINGTASSSALYPFFNGDTVATGYYSQEVQASSTTVSGSRENTPRSAVSSATSRTKVTMHISRDTDGWAIVESRSNRTLGSAITADLYTVSRTTTLTNITQLTLTATVASSLSIGTKARIYRGDL